jgi:hypothetical protein
VNVKAVIDAWQEMAARTGLSKIRLMSAARCRSLRARIEEAGIDGVLEAVSRIGASDFCLGRTNGWRADFDFLLQPSSLARILEGRYDNRRVIERRSSANGAESLIDQFGLDILTPLNQQFPQQETINANGPRSHPPGNYLDFEAGPPDSRWGDPGIEGESWPDSGAPG